MTEVPRSVVRDMSLHEIRHGDPPLLIPTQTIFTYVETDPFVISIARKGERDVVPWIVGRDLLALGNRNYNPLIKVGERDVQIRCSKLNIIEIEFGGSQVPVVFRGDRVKVQKYLDETHMLIPMGAENFDELVENEWKKFNE